MMGMSMDELIKIGTMIFGVGAVYGLIRADIRHMHDRLADIVKEVGRVERAADKANERVDAHIVDYHRK